MNARSKKNKFLLFSLVLMILLMCFLSFLFIKGIISVNNDNAYADYIEEYDYYLPCEPTDLQVKLFDELKKALNEGDDEKIAELVVENYIADFYTFSNKKGAYDVGGLSYVYNPQTSSIMRKAKNSYYKNLNEYLAKYNKNDLLEVLTTDVLSNDYDYKYEVDGVEYDSYFVVCKWSYKNNKMYKEISVTKPDDSLDEYSKLVNKMWFIVIKNGNRFEIIETMVESYEEFK